MRTEISSMRRLIAAGFAPLICSAPAVAGFPGAITFAPAAAAAIPTLGGTLLALLAGLLLVIGIKAARERRAPLLVAGLAAGALAAGGGGIKVVTDSLAGGSIHPFPITEDSGQTLDIENEGQNIYENETPVPMEVIDIDLFDPDLRVVPLDGTPPDCKVGSVVPPAERCLLNIVFDGNGLDGGDMIIEESDRRLKKNIRQIGFTYNALPLYEFRYRDRQGLYRGVMAQDVLRHTPSAVVLQPNGYYAVDYAALGLEMTRLR